MDTTEFDYEDLHGAGITVPSGQVARTAVWTTHLSDTERLTDMWAEDYLRDRLAQVPADSPWYGPLARHWARRAVQSARKRAHVWEDYAQALTDSMDAVALPGALMLSAIEYDRTATRPTSAQVIAASTRPMGRNGWSLKLEHDGTTLLHACGLPATRPDVWVKDLGTHVTRRDRVAYSGEDRYEQPQPCRYGVNGLQPSVEYTETGTAEYLTTVQHDGSRWYPRTERHPVVRRIYVPRLAETGRDIPNPWPRPGAPRFVRETVITMSLHSVRTDWETSPVADDGTRRGWRGHRRITWTAARRNAENRKRAARRAQRAQAGATAARGPVVGPWSMSGRSLPAAITRLDLGARVATVEGILRTAAAGATVDLGAVSVVVLDGSHVEHAGRAFPVREYARRFAIAEHLRG